MKMLKSRPITPVRNQAAQASLAGVPRTHALTLVGAAPGQPDEPAAAAIPAAATAPAAALQLTQSFLGLLAQSMLRQAQNAAASASVLPLLARRETGGELLDLQAAVVERMLQLQQDWWQDWTAWLDEFAQLRRADTLSEHMEQFYNLGAQAGALLKGPATDLVELQDTIQVDYGYWIARKLRAP
jgi:hypothetical protein